MEFIDDSSYFEILLKLLHNAGLINMINMICMVRCEECTVYMYSTVLQSECCTPQTDSCHSTRSLDTTLCAGDTIYINCNIPTPHYTYFVKYVFMHT